MFFRRRGISTRGETSNLFVLALDIFNNAHTLGMRANNSVESQGKHVDSLRFARRKRGNRVSPSSRGSSRATNFLRLDADVRSVRDRRVRAELACNANAVINRQRLNGKTPHRFVLLAHSTSTRRNSPRSRTSLPD